MATLSRASSESEATRVDRYAETIIASVTLLSVWVFIGAALGGCDLCLWCR